MTAVCPACCVSYIIIRNTASHTLSTVTASITWWAVEVRLMTCL